MTSFPRNASAAIPPDIEAAAVHWLGLRDAGQMTSSLETDFERWLAADERHVLAYASLDAMWSDLGNLSNRRVGDTIPNPDLLAPEKSAKPWKQYVPIPLAAAAALAIGLFVWQEYERSESLTRTVVTQVGASDTLKLPDGSVIRLNTDTLVDVQYTEAERRVLLRRGEAHFTVAKNRERPFVVQAGKVDVRAVGTAFNVRFDPQAVEVLVTEGKVQVDNAVTGNSLLATVPAADVDVPVLESGQRVVIPLEKVEKTVVPAPAAAAAVQPAAVQRALAWQEQRLEFEDVALETVISEFNRYNTHKLFIADEQLKAQRFSGKFRSDGYEGLVRLLESSFGVRVERSRDQTVLHSTR